MATIKEIFQTADWKSEKHVPVIEAADKIKKGELARITVSVGHEIPHPNTTEHHIAWIEVYFLAKGEKFPLEVGRVEFSCHGASTQGPNTSGAYTVPQAVLSLKTEKSGTILAVSFCNIHGLWENSQELNIE